MLTSLAAQLREVLRVGNLPGDGGELTTVAPVRRPLRCLPAVLALLFVAAFLPRALMAWKLDTICNDGTLYLRLASAVARGMPVEPEDAGGLKYGAYPLILAGLHRVGLPWEGAAEWWGVLMSTLTVLPLFGWLRRQFDDRVALVACLLYTVHPKFIEWSPEAIRDPTFWFFLVLSVYALWRGAAEVDVRWFLVAGVAGGITCLTRFEGCFLAFPLVGWTLLRLVRLEVARARLLAGLAACLLVLPAVFFLAGRFLQVPTQDNAHTLHEAGPLERARLWATAWIPHDEVDTLGQPASARGSGMPMVAGSGHAAVAEFAPPPADVAPHWTIRRQTWAFLHTMERGLTPLFGILMLAGYGLHFRMLNRADKVPVLLMALAVAGATWIHLWYAHQASSRYVLNIALLTTSAAALALLDGAQWAAARLARRWPRCGTPLAAATALVAVMAIVGWADALSSDMRSRSAAAALGRWIEHEYGPARLLVGSESHVALVAYYAQGHGYLFPAGLAGVGLADWIRQVNADVVLISTRKQAPEEYQPIIDARDSLGLELIEAARISSPPRHTIVLGRPAAHDTHAATHSTATAPNPGSRQ